MFTIYLAAALLLDQSGTGAHLTTERPVIDVHSADRLAKTLIRQHDVLTAVSLVYTSVPQSLKGEPKGSYWRRAISVSSAGMFRSDNGHGNHWIPSSLDPRRKILVITPKESTLLESLNRCVADFNYKYTSEKAPAVLRNQENFFDVLCWWPFKDWPPPQVYGHAYSMRALLKEGSYRLLPDKEIIGARPCYVLIVNDILTVWCDCDRPECILKSERYNPDSKAIDSRFEMGDYKQVGDNIWLPKRFRIVRFDSDAHTPQLRSKVIADITFLVSDIKINEDVAMTDFRQEYAPGTVRAIRSPGKIRYEPVVDGQLDHFKSILSWCRFHSLQTLGKQNSRWGNRLLIFVLSFLVGCGVAVAISRAYPRVSEHV